MRSLISLACLALAVPALAQSEQATDPSKMKTKLEAFVAQDGAVIVQGFSKIGEAKGQYGASVTVESKEFTNASTGNKEYGITVQVQEKGRLEREHTSYVDMEEIPSLVKGPHRTVLKGGRSGCLDSTGCAEPRIRSKRPDGGAAPQHSVRTADPAERGTVRRRHAQLDTPNARHGERMDAARS